MTRMHPEVADILGNDLFAEAVAADLLGRRHARSDCHSQDAARRLQREGLDDEFLEALDANTDGMVAEPVANSEEQGE